MSVLELVYGGMAASFDWWLGELTRLAPRQLCATMRRCHRGLVLGLGGGEITVSERTSQGKRMLGSVANDAPEQDRQLRALLRQAKQRGRPATICLAAELGLRKRLDLPLAARDDLEQLLRFEMDRLTPFRSDEVHFAQRIVATDSAARRISVELQLAPRRIVEQAVASAQRLGLSVGRVELAGGTEPLDLFRDEQDGGPRERRVTRALALLALILAVIAVAIPLRHQQVALEDLENQVAAARAEAEKSLELRARIDQLAQSARFLVGEKTRRPLATAVLAVLTRLVPDEAHIVQLDLEGDIVHLHGYARTASDLIALLDQSQLFRTPQFRSPVTQDPHSGTERFHLSVEIAPQQGEEG